MTKKKLEKLQITFLVVIGWMLLSTIGFTGKDTIYRNYEVNIKDTPYFTLVFRGIHDGVYPWQIVTGESMPVDGTEPGAVTVTQTNTGDKGTPPEGVDQQMPDSQGAGGNLSDGAADSGEGLSNGNLDESSDQTVSENKFDAVKEFVQVGEGYFDDAVFIGDSRTDGLRQYGGLDNAVFFANNGMNIYDLWTKDFCEVSGENLTLEEALSIRQYGKIYIQIGMNELGRGTVDGFIEEYKNTIEKFKTLQPNAIIYVEGIMKVTKKKSDKDPIFNNEQVTIRNDRIKELADQRRIFYIDLNDVVCDEEGNLRDELTFDDLHLYGSEYGIWVDFLKSKGIE